MIPRDIATRAKGDVRSLGSIIERCPRAIARSLIGATLLMSESFNVPVLWAADFTETESLPGDVVTLQGEYRALLIGIDDYEAMPKLEAAVNDVAALRQVLIERYGFKPDHIRTLLNKAATRGNIENALLRMSRLAAPTDSVLIYYAGHGQYSEDNESGLVGTGRRESKRRRHLDSRCGGEELCRIHEGATRLSHCRFVF